MSSPEKTVNMVIRLAPIEMAKVHAIADDVREPIAVVVRRWLREAYRERFGDATPPAPVLKHGGKLRLPKRK
ncbi:MAG TPA: hypothetical protein VF407_19265 [Polyangiaceae bacterium]